MTGRRMCGAAVLAIAAVFAVDVTSSGDERAPEAVLDGDEVRELLAILESHAFRGPVYCDLRLEALKQLGRVVAKGGEGLRDAAIRRVRERRGDDRRRAELVLAQVPELPADVVRPLLDDEDIEVSTWAYLMLRERAGADSPPSRELANFAQATESAAPEGREPLLDVHANVRAEVGDFEVIDGVAVADRERDDDGVWKYELARCTHDFDGDGVSEHFVAGQLSGRIHFLAMLRRPEASASWELAALAQPEFASHAAPVVADFDGDGRPDLGVAHDNCGIPTYGGFSVYSTKDRAFVEAPWAYHAPVRVLFHRPGEAPVFVARELHETNFGGTAIHCVGACAMRYELFRWNGRSFERAGVAFTRPDE